VGRALHTYLGGPIFLHMQKAWSFDTKLKLIDTLTEHLSFGAERCVRLSEQDSRALPVDSRFKDLAPPDRNLGTWSCCDQSDVVHTKFRVNVKNGDDEWMYLASDGTWKVVPPDIILWGRSGATVGISLSQRTRRHP
jgi:hypothetical protein